MDNINYQHIQSLKKQIHKGNNHKQDIKDHNFQYLPTTTDSLNEEYSQTTHLESKIFQLQEEYPQDQILKNILYFESKQDWQLIYDRNSSTKHKAQQLYTKIQQQIPQFSKNIMSQRQTCEYHISQLQNSVNQSIKLLSASRKNIKFISEYCYKKQSKIKQLHIKLNNLINLKKQAEKIKNLKRQLDENHSYQPILSALKKTQKYSTETIQAENSLAHTLRLFIPIHQSKLVSLMTQQIYACNILPSRYIWKKQDDQILAKAVSIILKKTKQQDKLQINIATVCRNFIKLLTHIRVEKQSQDYFKTLLYNVLQSLLIFLLSQAQGSCPCSYTQLLQSMSIMQYSAQSRTFFKKFVESYEQQKQCEFKYFMDELRQLSWQGIAEEDLRSWIKTFTNKYQWLHENGISKQFEQIRILISKKLFRPLFIDFLHNKNNKNVLSLSRDSRIIDLQQVHEQDLYKNCFKRYHCYRIWHRYKQIYHLLHPFCHKSGKWAMLVVQTNQKQKQQYEAKKIKKRQFFVNIINHNNALEYLLYGNILRYLWKNDGRYSQIIQFWTDIAAEYIVRKQPQLICQLQNKDYLFYQQILNKCHNLQIAQKQEKRLQKYLQLKNLTQQQHQQLYNYVMRNKFKAISKQFLQNCIWKVNCANQVQKMRNLAYEKFVCSQCQK